MKKPKVEKVNLPYASAAASFFGDQGASAGSSFLGKMFSGAARSVVTQDFAPPGTVKQPNLFGK